MFLSFLRVCLLLPSAVCLDPWEWLRCDSCRATIHQMEKGLGEARRPRSRPLSESEYTDVMDKICEGAFSKDVYGVKSFENKSFLFGPGVVDHLGPGKGFGQMGMGDYDKRLSSYCFMWMEEIGYDFLYSSYEHSRGLNSTFFCHEECQSSDSGTGPSKRKWREEGGGLGGRKKGEPEIKEAIKQQKTSKLEKAPRSSVNRSVESSEEESSLSVSSILKSLPQLSNEQLGTIIKEASFLAVMREAREVKRDFQKRPRP